MGYITKIEDYWVAPSAINISLNALGDTNRIQGSVASGAVISCYIDGIPGLELDNGRNPKRWPLSLTPTYFNSFTEKYVYAAIPRTTEVGTMAVIVFPSEQIFLDGTNEAGDQVGSEDYYYVWLHGIISATDGNTPRTWTAVCDFGSLGTYEDIVSVKDVDWYSYDKLTQIVTFLKGIVMKPGSSFYNLILGGKELKGVATADTSAYYIDSDTLVATPGYLYANYLNKKAEDTAEEQIGFLKGLWIGVKGLYEITADGIAKFKSLFAESVNAQRVQADDMQSSNFTGDGIADTGWKITNAANGHSKLTIDEIYIRMKAVFESLEVRERTYTGGDQIWSCAGNLIVRTDYLGNTETADHVPVMIPVHADGSPSSAGSANTFMVPQPGDTYGYSEVKVPWLLRGVSMILGRNSGLVRGLYSRYKKVRIVISDQEVASSRGANRAAAVPDINKIRRARCYFLAKDGDREIHNWWRINDLARCQTMNLANVTRETYISGEDTKAGNIFWWRKVIGVSYDPVQLDDGKWYHYFDVSFDYDLESSSPETMATSVMEGSDIPAAGDAVVQFGNTIIEGRMNLMMMEVNGGDAVGYSASADAPCLKAYRGVYSFDLTKCWIGGQCCKMKLSPKSGYEFYGPHFKQVTEYDVVPVPVERGLWTNICRKKNSQGQYIDEWEFEDDDYGRTVTYSDDDTTGRTSGVRKCYYYDKVSHNGSYWLCSIVDGSHWVNGDGEYITDAQYDALSEEAKHECARKQNYTIEEPSENSIDWTKLVEKGEKGDAGDTPISVFAWNQSPDTAPAISGNAYPPTGWNVTAPSRPSTAGDHYLWMSQSVKHANDTIDNWGTPVRISGDKGDAGEDSSDQEFVYIRLTTYPFPNNVTKPADATRGKVHGTGDWIPAADQYETDDWVPEGWSDTALPATENEKYVYAAIRKKSAGHDEDWDDFDEPFLWSNWGVQGIDGDGVQYVYKLFDHELTAAERESNIPTKPQSQTQGEWIPTGWSDDPLAPTVNMQYCYCSTIKKIGGSWADTFDTLGLWSRFSKDGQSAYKSTMFVRLNTTPTKPANNKGSYNNPSPSDCPAGTSGGSTIYWSDGIPSGEAQIWATSRIFTNDGTSPQQSSWSTPQPMSDTDTFDVEFAVMQTNDAIPATPTANNRHKDAYPYGYEGQVWFDPDLDKYSAEGVLRDFTQMYWRAERECKNGDWGDWTIQRIKGEKGDAGDTPISVFAWNQSPDTAPAISGNAYPPTGWNVTAPNRPSTAGDHYLWMSQSVKHANDTIDNWGTPVRISGDKGDAGEDSSDQEFVYIRLTTYPFPNNVTKPADATRGKVHGTGDWIPAADQYETDDWVPEGWSDTALPATENEKYVYAAIRKKSAGHDEDWDDFDEPFLWSNWGVQGIDGDGVQYVYKLFDHELTAAERESNIPTKPQSQTQGEWIPTGWSDDPLAPTANMQYCYCSTIKKIGGSWADTFDTLGLWSRFSKDGQSAYKSTMFVRLNTTPTKPANNKGSYNNPSPSDCPAGTSGGSTIYWSDGIPSGEAQIWATSRIFTNDGTSPQQSSWSTPQPMSDTDTFDVEFAVMQTNDAIPATPTANNRHKDAYPYGYEGQVWFDPDLDKYSAEGVLRDFTQMYWRAERECKNGDWGDWTIQRIKGEKGDTGTSVIINGDATYFHHVDSVGNTRPLHPTIANLGEVDLLDYDSITGDMIDVCEEIGTNLYGWEAYSVPVGTCYLFNKKLYEATETGWLDLGQFKGDNGKDGWMITADPANVIITQGLGSNSSQFSIVKVGFTAKKGSVAATISSIGTPTSTEFNVAKGTGDDAKKVVVSSPKTHGTPAEYYTEGTVLVTVNVTDPDTSSTVSFNVTVPCYANLLGTWKREVENGVETVVAHLTQYLEDEDGNIITSESLREDVNDATRDISTLSNTVTTQGTSISNLNTRMSTAEGNISTVTKKVNSGKNLLTGVLTGSGWNRSGSTVKTNDEEKFTLSSGQYLESPDITIESSVDYYTISYDANTQATIGIYDYGIQQTVSGTNGTTDDGRYYFRFAPGSLSGEYQIRFSGVSYIKHPQLETGNVATAFEADSSETSSRIHQTAEQIEELVNDTGVNIVNKTISLYADKVKFYKNKSAAQQGDPAKIWIDGGDGSLHAVDGNFEGTVRANNFYQQMSVFYEGNSLHDSQYSYCKYYCTDAYDTFQQGYYYDPSVVPVKWYYNFIPCTYDAEVVNLIPNPTEQWNSDKNTCYLPDPEDFVGKVVHVYAPKIGGITSCPIIDCVVRLIDENDRRFAKWIYLDGNNRIKAQVLDPSDTVALGTEAIYQAIYADGDGEYYWLKLL